MGKRVETLAAPRSPSKAAMSISAGRAWNESNSSANLPKTYAGAIYFQTGRNQNNNITDSFITRMTLKNGNVGIGTTTPGSTTCCRKRYFLMMRY
jgi:hypothetical protein